MSSWKAANDNSGDYADAANTEKKKANPTAERCGLSKSFFFGQTIAKMSV